MTEPDLAAFARACPPTSAGEDWAISARGEAVLAAIHREIEQAPKRRCSLRKLGIGFLTVAAVGGGGVAAYAETNHSRQPTVSDQAACNQTASLTANIAVVSTKGTTAAAAISVCSARWSELWPTTPKPANFAACVYPEAKHQAGGALVVIPAAPGIDNDSACRAIGADILP